jgi:hypothetical protein
MTIIKRIKPALILIAAMSSAGINQCDPQITRDPGFDLWCGDQLCAWKVERGSVLRVPTWNEEDPGVELVGEDVAIEQLTPAEAGNGTCIEFDLIANIEETAQVTLNTDLDGDGSDEQIEQMPTAAWKPLTFLISVAGPYSGVRFEIAKRGSGEAVLAQIEAKYVDDSLCAGLGTITAAPQPDGEPCNVAGDCASGICSGSASLDLPFTLGLFSVGAAGTGVCEGCQVVDGSDSCGSGMVCGAGQPQSPVRAVALECVAPASAPLGAQCATGAECATGLCEINFCSSCDEAASCGSGQQCSSAWPQTAFGVIGPTVCSPSAGLQTTGQACANDADCASGMCEGSARMQCGDGRECANNTDCPFGGSDGNALENGPCVTVGVEGGACQ